MDDKITLVKLSDTNNNWEEALKGYYGFKGEEEYSITLVKNLIFVVLYEGCETEVELPEVYDGFIQLSNGHQILVKDNKFSCNLPSDVSGFGILKTKKNV